jgi:hypothetical protein
MQAVKFATTQARAEATAQVLSDQGKVQPVQASGILEQVKSGEVACSAPVAASSDFEAEVHFQNPMFPSQQSANQKWDYGIIFAHPNDGLEYRLVLDSAGKWTLNLHAEGYDIENRDSTSLLDVSTQGSNTLKIAISGDEAHLYINGAFIDTLDLTMFEQGGASEAGYDISVCAGIMRENAAVGSSTLYDGYTLKSLP